MKLEQSITAVTWIPILFGLLLSSLAGSASADEPTNFEERTAAELPANFAVKKSRSTFDMKEFDPFISHELSRTKPRGSHADFGVFARKVHGQVVDHEGQPIVGAFVAFVERTGFSSDSFNESYDKTDNLGRFVVEGKVNQERIVVRRSATSTWRVSLKPKQTSVKIIWPKPATLELSIAQGLRSPAEEFTLRSTGYNAEIEFDDNGKCMVTDMPPGDYFVSMMKVLEFDEGNQARYVDVGSFSLKAGERKNFHCQESGNRRVSGKLKPSKQDRFAKIYRQRTTYKDAYRSFDIARVKEDGGFTSRPLPPGHYIVEVETITKPTPQVFIGFGGGPRIPQPKVRFSIPAENKPVEVNFTTQAANDTVSFVHGVLDSQGALGVSFSHTDVQVAQLERHADRDGVVNELFRIIEDKQSPMQWQHPSLRALSKMFETPGVVTRLMNLLKTSNRFRIKNGILTSLYYAKHHVDEIVEQVATMRSSENLYFRRGSNYVMSRLVSQTKHKDKVAGYLVEALEFDDEWLQTQIIANIGYANLKTTLPALRKIRRESESPRVRVWAAFAIWKITGEREEAIKLMTVRLRSNLLAGRWEAAYLLSNFENLPDSAIKALQAATRFTGKPRYLDGAGYERNRIKRTALSTLRKVAPNTLK